jgi:hypothetical protein
LWRELESGQPMGRNSETYYSLLLLRAIRDNQVNDLDGVNRFRKEHRLRFIDWGTAHVGEAPAVVRLLRDLQDAGLVEVSGVDLKRHIRVRRDNFRPMPTNVVVYDRIDDDLVPPRPELNLQLRVSDNLGEIQHVLGLSLVRLSELQTDGAMVVIPEVFPESRNKHQPIDVFVAMPFREELREVFDDHIRPVCEQHLSLSVFRADDLFSAQSVMADVWQAIRAAKVVVADCTDRNPNVFYEIGLAHVLGKQVVLLTQRADDVPFDVRHLR